MPEIEHLQSHLAACATRLEAIVPHSERQRTEPCVLAKPIDQIFPELWKIGPETEEKQLCRTLVASVDVVTTAGLAKIAAAQSARLEVIARHIAGGDAISPRADRLGAASHEL